MRESRAAYKAELASNQLAATGGKDACRRRQDKLARAAKNDSRQALANHRASACSNLLNPRIVPAEKRTRVVPNMASQV